jgi:hypothetical protein
MIILCAKQLTTKGVNGSGVATVSGTIQIFARSDGKKQEKNQ